ncbi:hypothetical protein I79_017433 [Cricetulus griseus]|uniref:Uncharacterized protein n=1 Tax=Cricetulus griseus TaxID=10029 RepID=G3I211_CRIGR|nr:hypothetical protein I79_017433 [Cricetulus griseus]
MSREGGVVKPGYLDRDSGTPRSGSPNQIMGASSHRIKVLRPWRGTYGPRRGSTILRDTNLWGTELSQI